MAEYSYPYMVRYSDSTLKYVTTGRDKGYDGIEKHYYAVEKSFTVAPSRNNKYIFNIFVML